MAHRATVRVSELKKGGVRWSLDHPSPTARTKLGRPKGHPNFVRAIGLEPTHLRY